MLTKILCRKVPPKKKISYINLIVKPCTKPQRKITPQQNTPKSFMKCLISNLDFFYVLVPCPDLAVLCLLPIPTPTPNLGIPFPTSAPTPIVVTDAALLSESPSNFAGWQHPSSAKDRTVQQPEPTMDAWGGRTLFTIAKTDLLQLNRSLYIIMIVGRRERYRY